MNTSNEKAMRLALEALESCGAGHITDGGNQWHDEKLVDKAIKALEIALSEREALAQSHSDVKQEPVAEPHKGDPDKNIENLLEAYWRLAFDEGKTGESHGDAANEVLFALRYLYTTPQQRTWVGLTDEEALAIDCMSDKTWVLLFTRAVEAKLKEKNT